MTFTDLIVYDVSNIIVFAEKMLFTWIEIQIEIQFACKVYISVLNNT